MFFKKIKFLMCLGLALSSLTTIHAKPSIPTSKKKAATVIAKDKCSAYLFVYFTGNRKDEEQIRFALSSDGYNFKALNQNKPIISSKKISLSGGTRSSYL